MSKQTVVLLNGAPASGKDTAAGFLLELFGEGKQLNFKDALYRETAKYFGVDLNEFIKAATDRNTKEAPSRKLFDPASNFFVRVLMLLLSMIRPVGFSPRQALIHVSENIIKPKFGKTFFGNQLAMAVADSIENIFFVADSGFIDEVKPLVESGYIVKVIRIHRDGCTFAGDSRTFLKDEDLKELGIDVVDLDNNGTLEELKDKLLDLATGFVIGMDK